MEFKNPAVLWALIALVIPIIVHLFQLRRFQKIAFTNVAFLKKIQHQSRKSSALKKWLTLLFRMLVITGLVLAFAQPYFPKIKKKTATETIIYLDNSFSMAASGEKGPLLKKAIKELQESLPKDFRFSLITNNSTHTNTDIVSIWEKLQQLPYTANQIDPQSLLLKAKSISENKYAKKQLIFISDFQKQKTALSFKTDSIIKIIPVKLQAIKLKNSSIDTAYLKESAAESIVIAAKIKSFETENIPITVSLYQNEKLIGKSLTSRDFEAEFNIDNRLPFSGVISLDDSALSFDNKLFFSINTPEKINVLVVNEKADTNFLKRLYPTTDFKLTIYPTNSIDYSQVNKQQLILLNQLKNIPNTLASALFRFTKMGGTVCIIPDSESDKHSYNLLLKKLGLPQLDSFQKQEKRLTTINFDHPLIKNVFERAVKNFNYPIFKRYYDLNGNVSAVLKLENNAPLLVNKNKAYLFSSPLDFKNSNFKNSQLIVPIFYNIASKALQKPELYFQTQKKQRIDIKTNLSKDETIKFAGKNEVFIPLQQRLNNSVRVTTEYLPVNAGNFIAMEGKKPLINLSYNYPRDESNLEYYQADDFPKETLEYSVASAIENLKPKETAFPLWKWFAIFAGCCILAEITTLKILA